jgi:hypothetical protein
VESLLNQVHYYQWNGTAWNSGISFEVRRCSTFAKEDMVYLSDDGTILLVSDGTRVTVYDWKENSKYWTVRGNPIQLRECSIETVSLSASGS